MIKLKISSPRTVIFSLILVVNGGSLCFGQDLPIPQELQKLTIRGEFIPSQFKAVGAVHSLTLAGGLIILRRAAGKAYYAGDEDPVHENDALYTLERSRCRIEFKDRNVLLMAPESHIDIDEVETNAAIGKKSALFRTVRGKLIIYALRLFRYREMILNLKTVTAVIGVRGTKFGVEVEAVESDAVGGNRRLMLAGLSKDWMAAEEKTQNVITRVYVFEGEVSVTSSIDGSVKRLRENEVLTADQTGLGEIRLDPDRTRAFREEVMTGHRPVLVPKPQPTDQLELKDQMETGNGLDEIRQRALEPPRHEDSEQHYP